MSYNAYIVLHLAGIMLLFWSLGGLCLHGVNGGNKETNRWRLWSLVYMKVGLLLILVAGFGLMSRLEISHSEGFPGWIWIKLTLWLLLGAGGIMLNRVPTLGKFLWWVLPILGILAALTAKFHG